MKITFKDKIYEINKKTRVNELLKEEIQKSKHQIMGCIVNNEYQRLDFELEKDSNIELIDTTSKVGIDIYKTTLLYIMGKAITKLYPKALITVNYQLGDAMYCQIDNMEITYEMLNKVYIEMKDIIDRDLKIEKVKMNREQAEQFYQEQKTCKGMLQLDLSRNKFVYMYFCEDYYNYFYDILAISTGVIKLFDLIKYKDGFLVRYPNKKNPNILPEYKELKKLNQALDEYEMLHRELTVNTVYRLNKAVKNEQIKDVIMIDEALHEKKIAQIADEIAKNPDIKMVLIAGPSSSGKTTFAQRLGIQLRVNGIKPVTISVDNYFVEREDNPKDENGNYDFECIEAIDLDLFNNHLKKLLKGEEIEMPEFDFYEGKKKYKGKKLKLDKDEILVIEGIHCLNDKLTSKIPKDRKYKIYISALTVLNMDYYNRISTTDNRLIRRIVRDYKFRGYNAKHTLETWHMVNKGEEKNIFPFQEEANSMFNTSLIYELGVLKDVAIHILEEIKSDEKEYAEARRLINLLQYFETIPEEYVPKNSLLKEFLGGGDFKY